MSKTSLAYVLVALSYLLPEADFHVRQLGIPCPSLLERTNLTEINIYGGKERLLASVATTNYFFGFTEQGLVHSIAKVDGPNRGGNIREYFAELASKPNVVTKELAHQLATQWLSSVGVNIEDLDNRYPCKITHPKLDKPVKIVGVSPTLKTTTVPYFNVNWEIVDGRTKNTGKPPIAGVTLAGPTKELVRLNIDPKLLTRPPIHIPGSSVLMNLPDAPFATLWAQREMGVSNVFTILRTSTAYQSVMVERMIERANEILKELGESRDKLLSLDNLTDAFVSPPMFGFRGSVSGEKSLFQFDEAGMPSYVFMAAHEASELRTDTRDYYEQMSRRPFLVNSNNVVTLAQGWIESIGVDTTKFDTVAKPVAHQYQFQDKSKKWRPGHIWWVLWPAIGATNTAVSVEVNGVTKRPSRIHIHNSSYWRTPGIGIGDAEAQPLIKTPDSRPQRHPLAAHLNVIDARSD